MLRTFLIFASLAFAAPAFANPTIEENWNTYPIDGATAVEIHGQLYDRGPNGFWAYADWRVNWSSSCDVHVRINYLMPSHEQPHVMDEPTRQSWERMIKVLGQHEANHGHHGISAAKEIVTANCEGADAIIEKWVAIDRKYDEDTNHGLTEGVFFPDEADPNIAKTSTGGPGDGPPPEAIDEKQSENCANGGGNAEENFPLCGSEQSLSSEQRQEGLTLEQTSGDRSESR